MTVTYLKMPIEADLELEIVNYGYTFCPESKHSGDNVIIQMETMHQLLNNWKQTFHRIDVPPYSLLPVNANFRSDSTAFVLLTLLINYYFFKLNILRE